MDIPNLITTGSFKSPDLLQNPREYSRRLEDHVFKVQQMFDLVRSELVGVSANLSTVAAVASINAVESISGGSGVVDHALLKTSSLGFTASGHLGFLDAPAASPTVDGQVLASTILGVKSWVTLTAGTVTDVTASSPLFSSGGATPQITIQAADSTHNGYMSSAQVLSLAGKLDDAPSDGSTYGRKNGAWSAAAAGGSVTTVTNTPADGVTIGITDSSTIPNLTVSLGVITPTAVTIDAGNLYKIDTSVLARFVATGNWFLGDSGNATVSGSFNLGWGISALEAVTSGNSNICIGVQAGYGITTGSSNILIGTSTGLTITTGSGNVVIGNNNPGNLSNQFVLSNSVNTLVSGVFHATAATQTLSVNGKLSALSYAAVNIVGSSDAVQFKILGNSTQTSHLMDVFASDGTTARFHVLGDGNVGIGTAAPEAKLDIVNTTIIGQLRLSTNKTDSTIKFGGLTTGHYLNAEEPILVMMGASGATENYINFGGGSSTANTSNIIRFYTAADNTTITGTERMRIQPTGRVGIGITAPTSLLHIVGSADIPQFTIKANATQTSDVFNALNSSGSTLLSLNSSGALTISGASTAILNTNTVGSLEFYTYDNSNITNRTVARIKAVAEGDYIVTDNAKTAITFETHGASGDAVERMRITNAGKVGIGTTTPSATLHLAAGTATASTAPIKLTAGTLLTAAELGVFEYVDDGTTGHLYFTLKVATVTTRVLII